MRCVGVDVEFPLASVTLLERLRGLSPNAPRVRALSGVSLDVPSGNMVGVMGNNGAGKTTLLRVLGEVMPPTRGTVSRLGTIAGVFELGGVGNRHLTGREYATRYLRLIGVANSELPAMLDDIQEFAELGAAFERRVRTYSTGMAARLYFATATAAPHDIYLIDELLSVGDEHFQSKCRDRVHALLRNGASGVVVTHDWSAVVRLCTEAHVLERGRFTFSGAADKAIVHYLNIAPPPAGAARFVDSDVQYEIETGRDATLVFAIDLAETEPVEFSISIEVLRIGVGWEIALLSDWVAVGERPGRYDAVVRVPKMPLPAGTYSLNAFLRRRPVPGATPQIYDIRSWTTGNGLTLTVTGTERDRLRLPFRVARAARPSS